MEMKTFLIFDADGLDYSLAAGPLTGLWSIIGVVE